jgi:hypothetical protein
MTIKFCGEVSLKNVHTQEEVKRYLILTGTFDFYLQYKSDYDSIVDGNKYLDDDSIDELDYFDSNHVSVLTKSEYDSSEKDGVDVDFIILNEEALKNSVIAGDDFQLFSFCDDENL